MKTRYEYTVTARKKGAAGAIVAQMTCFGDNSGDAISHAKQWWKDQDQCDYEAWCKITATRTGRKEQV